MAHILVVDDEPSVLAVLVTILEQLEHRCMGARDGEESIALFKAHTFDCVITDLDMPRIDGLEFVTLIREINTDIPIIFTTGGSLNKRRLPQQASLAQMYLDKPIGLRELAETISAVRYGMENE